MSRCGHALAGFKREDLRAAIDKGDVVKATLMRATLHLVSAMEYAAYSKVTLDGIFAAWRPPGGPDLATLKDIHDKVFKFAAKTPRSRDEIRDFIARDAPKEERLRNWYFWAAVTASGIIWEKSGAYWEYRQLARFVAPPARLRKAPKADAAFDLVARRYLGAFGPSSVGDLATWSGCRVAPLRARSNDQGPSAFRDERGRELFDLPRHQRPSADTVAPPRFLARFDARSSATMPPRGPVSCNGIQEQVIFSAEGVDHVSSSMASWPVDGRSRQRRSRPS